MNNAANKTVTIDLEPGVPPEDQGDQWPGELPESYWRFKAEGERMTRAVARDREEGWS